MTKIQMMKQFERRFVQQHPFQHERIDTNSLTDYDLEFPDKLGTMIVGNVDKGFLPAIGVLSGEEEYLVKISPFDVRMSIISSDECAEELYVPGSGKSTPKDPIAHA